MILWHVIRRFLKLILDHIFSFVTALALCQLPQFINQYQDALVGAHFEAEKAVAAIRVRAAQGGKSLDKFLGKHLLNSDPDFKASGELMRQQLEREKYYRQALIELREASLWLRPWVFLKYYDHSLAQKVELKPALPLSLEAAVYVLVGILLGTGIFRLLAFTVRFIFSPGKPKKPALKEPLSTH